ncbi:restriction endonuclease subunit S [Vibrio harveyi]|uniref:restriction endonuclease subunit S n=1 Tax=Vibrio harveyi TaxID=669 RepID=UPI004064BE4C
MSWPMAKLGDVLKNVQPGFASGKDLEDGTLQVRMNNVKPDGSWDWSKKRIVPATDKQIEKYSLEVGDVLFNATNSAEQVGKSALYSTIVENNVCFSNHFLRLRTDNKRLLPQYLVRYLSYLWRIRVFENMVDAWVNQATVRREDFLNLEIPLPPLDEQKRIAAILDKADAIRQKRKQAIVLADEFLRSVFLEMFGDPMSNPKGWEVKPLGSMILKGPTNGLYKPSSSYGSGCRILRIDGFYDGELVGEDKLKRVELSEDELVKYLLPARSVVINRVNSPEYLGKCAFVENLSESTVFESNMMNFIVDENLINPRFLVMQLQMPNIKKQIQTRAKHAVNQSSINQQDVKGFDLLVPPINIQNKYESIVEALKKNRNALVDHQDKSFGLFSSLSQKAFSGQL